MSKFVNCNIFSAYCIAKLQINFKILFRCFGKSNAVFTEQSKFLKFNMFVNVKNLDKIQET